MLAGQLISHTEKINLCTFSLKNHPSLKKLKFKNFKEIYNKQYQQQKNFVLITFQSIVKKLGKSLNWLI
jgi:hypothetical protein